MRMFKLKFVFYLLPNLSKRGFYDIFFIVILTIFEERLIIIGYTFLNFVMLLKKMLLIEDKNIFLNLIIC